MCKSIFLFEENQTQRQCLTNWLTTDKYSCTSCSSVNEAISNLSFSIFDLIILSYSDSCLEKDIITHIRCRLQKDTPIISVHDNENRSAISSALTAGANDFLVKPLSRTSLTHAISTTIDTFSQPTSLTNCHPYCFDVKNTDITLNGHRLSLSSDEYRIAAYLFFFRNRVVLLSELNREMNITTEQTVTTLEYKISQLRHRLQLSGQSVSNPKLWQLQSIFGIGYRLRCTDTSDTQISDVITLAA